ncbi:MAG: hypothetical protein ACU0A5_03495 [Salipiger marinus]|uniref:hypothetical protein n=1 Tax=Salipiger marinus TaxID=555512 RepID=UPI004059917A
MPQNDRVSLPPRQYTLLTGADVSAITLQNLSYSSDVWIIAAEDATPPTSTAAGIRLEPGSLRTLTLADIWLGITPVRIFAWSEQRAELFVSHA